MDHPIQRLTVHPTPAAAREAARRACGEQGGALRPPHVSFRQLEASWSRCAVRTGDLRGRPLGESARQLLAMRIVAAARGEDAPRSWSGALVAMAEELAQIGMDAESLERSVRGLGGSLGAGARHAAELYRAYRAAVPPDRVDTLDQNRALLAEAGKGLPDPWEDAHEVRFVHVGRLNPFRQLLLSALIRSKRHRVRIAPAFEIHVAETLFARWIAPEIAACFDAEIFEPPAFSALVEALIQRSPDILAGSGLAERVHLTRSVGIYGEVEDAGRRIRSLIEAGCPPHEIGIGVRGLAPYEQAVADVFARFGIPTNFRRGIPSRLSPTVRAVVALLESVRDGLPVARLADALDNDLLGSMPVPPYGRAAAVRALRAWRLPALDAATIDADVSPSPDGDLRPPRDDARPGLPPDAAAALRSVCSWADSWHEPRAAGTFARRLRDELRQAGVAERTAADAGRGRIAAVAGGRALLAELLEEIADADAAVEGPTMGLSAFLEFLAERLDLLTVPMPAEVGGVDVRNAYDLAGVRYRHLFILGLNDGVFPAHPPPNGLLPDDVRESINRGTDPARRLRTRRLHAAAERALFLQSIQAASEGLWLSARFHDGQVTELVPSPFFEDTADLVAPAAGQAFPGTAGPSGGGAPPLGACAASDEAVHRIFLASGQQRAAATGVDEREQRLAAAAVRALATRDRFANIIERIRIEDFRESSDTRGADDAPHPRGPWAFDLRGVPDALERIERRLREPLAPTAIERLARCPAAFFLADILGLEERESPEPTVDPRDEGRAVHQLVSGVYARLRAHGDAIRQVVLGCNNLQAVDPGILRNDEILDTALEAESRALAPRLGTSRARGGRPEFRGVAWGAIRHAARTVLDFDRSRDATRLVLCLEQAFGPDEPAPWGAWDVVRSAADAPPFRIRGRIDRIDLELDDEGRPSRLWVTDLKSRSVLDNQTPSADDVISGRSAQLPIYAAVASRLAPELAVDARFLVYGDVPENKRDGIRLGDLLASAQPPLTTNEFVAPRGAERSGERMRSLEQVVADLLSHAERGEFFLTTEECDTYCPFRGLCGRTPGDARP